MMKEVKAFIRKHKLHDVTLALHKIEGLTGLTVADVRGFGRGRPRKTEDGLVYDMGDLTPKLQLTVYCKDDIVEQVVSSIQTTAHTGLHSDGKIYILGDVRDVIRISTGERGE